MMPAGWLGIQCITPGCVEMLNNIDLNQLAKLTMITPDSAIDNMIKGFTLSDHEISVLSIGCRSNKLLDKLIRSPGTPDHVLHQLTKLHINCDIRIELKNVVKNFNASENTLNLILHSGTLSETKILLIYHNKTTVEMTLQLSKILPYYYRTEIAKETRHIEVIKHFMLHGNKNEKSRICDNRQCTREVIELLTNDRSEYIRFWMKTKHG